MRCSLENLPGAMDNRDGWREWERERERERVREIWASLMMMMMMISTVYKIKRDFLQAVVVSVLLYDCISLNKKNAWRKC